MFLCNKLCISYTLDNNKQEKTEVYEQYIFIELTRNSIQILDLVVSMCFYSLNLYSKVHIYLDTIFIILAVDQNISKLQLHF